jgi:hypothetical protein
MSLAGVDRQRIMRLLFLSEFGNAVLLDVHDMALWDVHPEITNAKRVTDEERARLVRD